MNLAEPPTPTPTRPRPRPRPRFTFAISEDEDEGRGGERVWVRAHGVVGAACRRDGVLHSI